MKLEAGIYRYSFPGGSIRSAGVWVQNPEYYPGAHFYLLTQLVPHEMIELHRKMREDGNEFVAMPVYISNVDGELWFYPIPDKAWLVEVRYEISCTM